MALYLMIRHQWTRGDYVDEHTFIQTTMWPAFSFRRRCSRSRNNTTEQIIINSTANTIINVVCGNSARSRSMAVDIGNKASNGDSRCSYAMVKLSSTGLVLKVTSEIMIHLAANCRSNFTYMPAR